MSNRYDNILIPIDFEQRTSALIEQGYYLARLMNCPMSLIHIINKKHILLNNDLLSDETNKEKENEIEIKIRRLANHYSTKFGHEINYEILEGNVFENIINYAKKHYARLIVMGKSGKTSLLQNSIGKYTAQVVRNAHCPVFTINTIVKSNFDKILLPLDMSKQIHEIITIAIAFNRYYGSNIKLLSIITNSNFTEESSFVEKLKITRSFLLENNIACSSELIYNFSTNNTIADRIIQYSIDIEADVIMLMTKQEDLNNSHIGSTASNVIKNSPIPIISITPHNSAERNF